MPDTQEETTSPYTNGPYMVLSDSSTFDGLDGCFIAYITDAGQEELEACSDFNAVEADEFEIITMDELLDAYNKVHGTDL